MPCHSCGTAYGLGDTDLRRQIETFDALCRQIAASEEILSNVSVGIQVNGKQVCVPYRILLTRLNSKLDLSIGDQPFPIEFRLEPRHDYPFQQETNA